MPANEDQIKFWNEQAGQNWTILQARMDANLAAIGDAVLAFAHAEPGMAVLDVGCGTGFTSLALAGAGAKVTGLDISKPMLALARERAAIAGLPVTFIEADASAAPFAPENPWASAPLMAAKPFLPEQPPPDPLAPGPFAFADPKRLEDILSQSGFSDIRIEKLDSVMPMASDLGLAASQALQIGPLSRAVGEVDDATRAAIVEAVRDVLAGFVRPDGEIAPPAACWLVGAKA